jgi:TfoX/Sxy family transcriptional regulator of competence genes
MAVNPILTKRVREALATTRNVEEKKMFRGIAFMVNGKMCVTVGDDRMMCRIDPDVHEEATSKKGVETVVMRGKDYIGWVYVNESVIPDKKALMFWVKMALAYNKQI